MQWTSAPNIAGAPLPQRARGYWKALFGVLHGQLERLLEAERAQLPPWLAVGFGSGIAAWFALDARGEWFAFLCIASGLALHGFTRGEGRAGRAIGWFALAAAIGCALIWARSEWVAQPRLEHPVVAGVAGTVDTAEHLASKGTVRLALRTDTTGLPSRVRVSVDDDKFPPGVSSGAIVRMNARLAPPPPMALPGTYDFARDAWFRQIGAVGKALGPVVVERPAEPAGFEKLRTGLRQHIGERLPESSAGIAIALATGDQNAVGEDDADAMRRSGLTHLLSVSGLHIAAVVAFTMFLSLRLLALSELLALRFNLVLVSAGIAALAGIGYTLLTGAQVPTVRSCVAAVLVLAGIALGREAISIRLIAAGALVVLMLKPEALAGASFQMSFAAVTAIVALHSTSWSRRLFQRREEGLIARGARALLAMVMTGLAVELALVPFALFHFHRAGLYGVAANIVAIPLTTFVIMPLEAGALLLDVLGWGKPLWFLCGAAIDGLLRLAHAVASAKGAVALLPSIPVWAFGLMAAGGIWLCLWNTRVRLLGLAPFAAGAVGALLSPTPDLLVTGDGRHLALVSRDGTPLILRDRAGDYVRDLLSEASGYDGDPGNLGSRPYSDCSRDACAALLDRNGRRWRLLATRSGVAIYLGESPRVETVAERIGAHPWAQAEPKPRTRPRARFRTGR